MQESSDVFKPEIFKLGFKSAQMKLLHMIIMILIIFKALMASIVYNTLFKITIYACRNIFYTKEILLENLHEIICGPY